MKYEERKISTPEKWLWKWLESYMPSGVYYQLRQEYAEHQRIYNVQVDMNRDIEYLNSFQRQLKTETNEIRIAKLEERTRRCESRINRRADLLKNHHDKN